MKRVWKKNDKEAVSPVIATILMVAITVVLAAVLYVMVAQYMNVDDTGLSAGSINSVDIRSNSSAKIVIGAFTGTAKPMDVKIVLEDQDDNRVSLTWSSIPDSDNYAMTSSDPAVSALYRDLVPAGNSIDAGDTIVVNGLTPGNSYEIILVKGSDQVQLTGQTTFTLGH